MSQYLFLTVASFIALVVGAMALVFPSILLESKGVLSHTGTLVWVREMGVMLIATGVTAFFLRRCEGSPALRALMLGQTLLQLCLLPIEPWAYAQGTITKLSGIVPNTMLHVALAFGFFHFASKMRVETARSEPLQDTLIDPVQRSQVPLVPFDVFGARGNNDAI